MIILVKSGSYGGNALRYAMEKEKARVIKLNFLPEHITPIAIWNRMKLHCMQHEGMHTCGRPIKDFMVSLVISPQPGEVKGWTDKEWEDLTNEVLHEIDRTDISDLPKCKRCKPTNFSNTIGVSAQHNDSRSGVIHLHIDLCRLDMDGRTNDLHQIHLRCMRAAEIINRRHGWKQPAEIREERQKQMTKDCFNILHSMRQFDRELYFEELRRRGYDVEKRTDSKGKLCGYTLGINATVIKASALGNGHNLLASKLEGTWLRLHPEYLSQVHSSSVSVAQQQDPSSHQSSVHIFMSRTAESKPFSEPTFSTFCIKADGINWDCKIPDTVKDVFFREAKLPDDVLWSKVDDVIPTAVLLFCGYIDAATYVSTTCGGGGGGSDTRNWGRKKDEDDFAFARRCLNHARKMHARSRGLHR